MKEILPKADEEEQQSIQGRNLEISSNSSKPNPSSLAEHLKSPMDCKQENSDELELTRAEITQVKEENERLKTTLAQKIKDYRSLQTRFTIINNKEPVQLASTNQIKLSTGAAPVEKEKDHEEDADKEEKENKKSIEPELQMSLSLGGSGSRSYHREDDDDQDVKKRGTTNKEKEGDERKALEEEDLELGLNFGYDQKKKKRTKAFVDVEKYDGSDDVVEEEAIITEEVREVEAKKEGWVSRKILKNMKSGNEDEDDDLQYNPSKKARVSVRARCDGLMINDGCQWRKYGQKISKGNPCPRSYYRCTVAAGCPVRKQVQRCAEDMTILTTTYEGKHSHHIPPAATAMASTTTAAVNMMLSGASSSRPGSGGMAPVASLNGLNLSFPGNPRSRPHLSISPSHPTITLDLTLPELPSSSTSQQTHQASRLPLMNLGSSSSRFYPSPFNHPSMESSTAPVSWSGGYLGYHGAQLFGGGNRDPFMLHNNGAGGQTTQESFYSRPNLQMIDNNKPQLPTSSLPQNTLTDTISAATKAITSDPTFQSALAMTVATVLSGRNQERGETMGLGLKREDYMSSILPYSPNWKNNLVAQRPSLPFSNQKKDNSSPPANQE